MATNDDIVEEIAEIQKPGDVADFWDKQVRPNKEQWSYPLSELELGYIQAFRDPATPKELQMRVPVDPRNLTPEESEQSKNLFGGAADSYANYENRRRILAHYVYTHPATVRLEMGLFRLFRDVNPVFSHLRKGGRSAAARRCSRARMYPGWARHWNSLYPWLLFMVSGK